MGIFQKHPRVFTEELNIHPVQIRTLAMCESCTAEDVSNNKANRQDSILDAECLGLPESEMMDITEAWLDTENTATNISILTSEINSRPPMRGKEELKDMYPRMFSGIGTFEDYMYHIELDSKVKPIEHPPRRIALSLQPKLETELDEIVKQGIIVPVDEPADWVNSLVVREKPNGSLRICLDPKDLNKAIKREHYPVPTVDMVTNRLQGETFFHI